MVHSAKVHVTVVWSNRLAADYYSITSRFYFFIFGIYVQLKFGFGGLAARMRCVAFTAGTGLLMVTENGWEIH